MKKLLLIALLIVGCENSTQSKDCAGVAGGTAVEDDCGVCGGDGSTCFVTDIDGNVYETVQIGHQLWMAENLKVAHYRNGDDITTGLGASEWIGVNHGAYSVYDDDPSNVDIYGTFYNWYAVDDARGLCMSGWHVPSDDEYKELEMFLGMSEGEANSEGWRGTDEGIKLKDDLNWNGSNESGFTGLPGGYRSSTDGSYIGIGNFGYFWTASEYGGGWRRNLQYNRLDISRVQCHKEMGYSIRCIKD